MVYLVHDRSGCSPGEAVSGNGSGEHLEAESASAPRRQDNYRIEPRNRHVVG